MKKINVKAINKKYLGVGALAAVLVIGTTVSAASAYTTSNDIGEEAAKEIAFVHAGVTETEVTGFTCQKDTDDGILEYDVEFWVGNVEYDYEINRTTGEILNYDLDVEKSVTTTKSSEVAKETTIELPTLDVTPTEEYTDVAIEEIVETESTTSYIGETNAKEIALLHAGIDESDATFLKIEFDIDDGIAEYEVEWNVGTMEYEYTINAITGSIMEYDVELDD